MIFVTSLVMIVAAGMLAIRADGATVHARRFEVAAGLMLMVGLSLIGWGLNVRH